MNWNYRILAHKEDEDGKELLSIAMDMEKKLSMPAVVGQSEKLKCMMNYTDGNCDCGISNCIEGGW